MFSSSSAVYPTKAGLRKYRRFPVSAIQHFSLRSDFIFKMSLNKSPQICYLQLLSQKQLNCSHWLRPLSGTTKGMIFGGGRMAETDATPKCAALSLRDAPLFPSSFPRGPDCVPSNRLSSCNIQTQIKKREAPYPSSASFHPPKSEAVATVE